MVFRVAETWLDVLVPASWDDLRIVLISCFCWTLLTMASMALSPILSENYRKFDRAKKRTWDLRVVSTVHAFYTFATISGYYWPTGEIATDPYYGYNAESQYYFAVTTGYFLWDLCFSYMFEEGPAFVFHGALSFGVYWFSLWPFLHGIGRFYHGVFEVGSVWLHVRNFCVETIGPSSIITKIIEGWFVIAFTVVRIILGTTVSYSFWVTLIGHIANGTGHSKFVLVYYLVANGGLMLLQYYWFLEIIRQLYAMIVPAKAEDSSTGKEKGKGKGKATGTGKRSD